MRNNQIKITTLFTLLITLFIISTGSVEAHSGRTDANGGHNCNVGACAGTYHYHNGGSAPAPVNTYEAPTPTIRYVAPTAIPTAIPTPTTIPTKTPTATPSDTPTPTIIVEPTNKPLPIVNQNEVNTPQNTGFWGFILSLFGF